MLVGQKNDHFTGERRMRAACLGVAGHCRDHRSGGREILRKSGGEAGIAGLIAAGDQDLRRTAKAGNFRGDLSCTGFSGG